MVRRVAAEGRLVVALHLTRPAAQSSRTLRRLVKGFLLGQPQSVVVEAAQRDHDGHVPVTQLR